MSHEIIDLDAHRKQRAERIPVEIPGDYDGLTCPDCGCGWFFVEEVSMDKNGEIGGWGGIPKCTNCAQEVLPDGHPGL